MLDHPEEYAALKDKEKDRSTIHRRGRTLNLFEDSSGRRTTVNSAPSFHLLK